MIGYIFSYTNACITVAQHRKTRLKLRGYEGVSNELMVDSITFATGDYQEGNMNRAQIIYSIQVLCDSSLWGLQLITEGILFECEHINSLITHLKT
jgi:hypothetical protein